jgi:hypothetical protein
MLGILLNVIKLPGVTIQTWKTVAAASVGLLVLLLAAGFWPARRRM